MGSRTPGTQGGSSCHDHEDHPAHRHKGTTAATGSTCCICPTSTTIVASGAHTHTYTTGTQLDAAEDPITLDHSEESHLPPYYTAIPLRRK